MFLKAEILQTLAGVVVIVLSCHMTCAPVWGTKARVIVARRQIRSSSFFIAHPYENAKIIRR